MPALQVPRGATAAQIARKSRGLALLSEGRSTREVAEELKVPERRVRQWRADDMRERIKSRGREPKVDVRARERAERAAAAIAALGESRAHHASALEADAALWARRALTSGSDPGGFSKLAEMSKGWAADASAAERDAREAAARGRGPFLRAAVARRNDLWRLELALSFHAALRECRAARARTTAALDGAMRRRLCLTAALAFGHDAHGRPEDPAVKVAGERALEWLGFALSNMSGLAPARAAREIVAGMSDVSESNVRASIRRALSAKPTTWLDAVEQHRARVAFERELAAQARERTPAQRWCLKFALVLAKWREASETGDAYRERSRDVRELEEAGDHDPEAAERLCREWRAAISTVHPRQGGHST